MRLKNMLLVDIGLTVLLACSLPSAAQPTATVTVADTRQAASVSATIAAPTQTSPTLSATATTISFTPIPSTASTTAPAPQPLDFCSDAAVTTFLQSFKAAILSSNGASFASLVSPSHGLDVRYFRYVAPVNYDQEHAKFVFDSTYVINWGPQPGSGEDLKGSFHDVIIPSLQAVLGAASTTYVCNQIKTGGASYNVEWLYPNINYYSIFFPGTDAYGGLDWETWLTGVHYVQGKPYLYALIHLDWEP